MVKICPYCSKGILNLISRDKNETFILPLVNLDYPNEVLSATGLPVNAYGCSNPECNGIVLECPPKKQ